MVLPNDVRRWMPWLSSLLFGAKATEPVAFVAVVLALAAVTIAACYVPAR